MSHDFAEEQYAGRRLQAWITFMMERDDVTDEELAQLRI